jgi:molybdopterin synthase catalytic subunit
MIDTLKTEAPFWKKEATANSTRWLPGAGNNPP